MFIHLSSTITSSSDNAVTNMNASSSVCTTTYNLTVMLAKCVIIHKPISDLGEPRRKRKREHSGSSSTLSCVEMGVEFQQYMVPRSAAEQSSSSSHSQSPGGHHSHSPADCYRPPPSSSRSTPLRSPSRERTVSSACLAQLSSPARPMQPPLLT